MDNFITNLNVFIEINILQIQPAKWRPFRSGLNIKFTSFNIQQISILLIYIWSNQTRVFKKNIFCKSTDYISMHTEAPINLNGIPSFQMTQL